jgi:nucleotide-binding universal stress UspA family protein
MLMSNAPPRSTQILVAVDFSPAAQAALAWACEYAASHPSQMHVLHVLESHLAGSSPGGMDQVTAELDRFSAQVSGFPRGAVMKHVAFGNAAREIVHIAEKLGTDLLVIGTSGLRGLAQLLIGSVARRVVCSAPCPVVVLKARQDTIPAAA